MKCSNSITTSSVEVFTTTISHNLVGLFACRDSSNALRTGLYEFLNARGINGDLSRFLHQYMWNKDRIELLRWLGKVQSYIEK